MAHTLDTKATGSGSTNPTTLAYTCGSGATVLVLGIVVAANVARTGSAPTYNGIALTQANTTRIATETNCELWYLLNPSIGSYTISVSNTNLKSLFLVASSYKAQAGYTSVLDVDNGATGTTVSTSCAVTTVGDGDVIVDATGTGNNSVPTANSHTLLYKRDDGAYCDEGQYNLQATHGLITFTYTQAASDDWCQVVAAFKEVIAGYNYSKTITEQLQVFDLKIIKSVLTKSLVEALQVYDTISSTRVVGGQTYTKELYETLQIHDQISKVTLFMRAMQECLQLHMMFTQIRRGAYTIALRELFSFLDSFTTFELPHELPHLRDNYRIISINI